MRTMVIDRVPASRLYKERHCRECGRLFFARSTVAMFCTRACQMRAWRAVAMLAGTHGWVNRQFKRLDSA